MKNTGIKFRKRAAAVLLCLFVAFACCACGEKKPVKFDLAELAKLPEIRFASFYGREESDECRLKMRVPFDDTYTVSFSSEAIGNITVVGEDGGILVSSEKAFDIELKDGDLVYLSARMLTRNVKIDITAQNHSAPLPFDIEGAPDTSGFDTSIVDGDPLMPAELEAKWRGHGKYILSNAPETLEPQYINTARNRNDISNEEIFFVFEHGTDLITGGVYYGYQVLNTGEEDAYITVKNIGFQLNGQGSYYGESVWKSFYNTKFELPDMSEWTDSEKSSFEAWFNFSGAFSNVRFQPVTYRVPAGQYIYVLGGTTVDAFNRYNVAMTANRRAQGGCQNGAVLFDVVGKAEGIFYIYDDPAKVGVDNVTPGGSPPKSVYGPGGAIINGINDGTVVDMSAVWTFSDNTPSQLLPVKFTNFYTAPENMSGESFGKVDYITRERECKLWYTHCNSHFTEDALGVDTVELSTVCDGENVKSGVNYYGPAGSLTDMGNWMVDYIDVYTFVNRGDRDREVTVMINPCVGGALSVFARDEHGNRIAGSEKFSMYYQASQYGDAVEGVYYYTFTVPAHSVKQISFEYNLLANGYGKVSHSVELH